MSVMATIGLFVNSVRKGLRDALATNQELAKESACEVLMDQLDHYQRMNDNHERAYESVVSALIKRSQQLKSCRNTMTAVRAHLRNNRTIDREAAESLINFITKELDRE